MATDEFSSRSTLSVGDRKLEIHRLDALQQQWDVARLPYTLRILLENVLRTGDRSDVEAVAGLGRDGRAEPRDLVLAGPRPAPGLHRRPGRRRPRRDARRDGRPGRRPGADQPADSRRARDRPLGAGRRLRLAQRVRPQRRVRVRAQPRALRLPPLGPEGLPRLQGRAARDGDRPPGEPRVPRPRGRGARRLGLPRHARRHRLAHDDGERARRAGLGCRRDRGRGREARRAALDARPAGRRLQADRPAPRGRDGHRSRPDRHPDPAPGGRGREVRRVLRARARQPAARRSRDDREHVARVRRDLRLLPRRRPDAELSAPDRPQRGAARARRGVLQGEHALARPERGADLLPGGGARPLDRRAFARRPAPPAGPRPAHARQDRVPRLARDVRREGPDEEREPRPGRRRHVPGERSDDRAGARRVARAGRRRHSGRGRRPRPEERAGQGNRLRARARQSRDRRDHVVHEHVEPAGDGRGRPAGEEGDRARPEQQALGQDEPGARLEGRDGVLRPRRPDGLSRAARLPYRRLRLHDLHRKLRARCRRRSRSLSRRATSSSAPCSRATATSRPGSTPR